MSDRASRPNSAPDEEMASRISLWNSSSGRSSVSLNTLLSEYFAEMKQIAEGTFLPPGEPTPEASPQGGQEVKHEADQDLQDMIIQGLESFPISCCNSWGIPNLSNRMSLGVPFEPWNHQGPAHEWLAKIARPPAPKFEAAIPEDEQVNLPLPPTVGSDRNGPPQWHSTGLRTGAGAATASAEAAPAQGFTAMLQSRDVGGQLAQPLPFRTALQPSPLLPAREDAAALENAAAFTPDARTVWPGVPLPSRGDTGTPSEAAGGSNEGPTSGGDQSLNNDSHEQAESACGSKGKRTKEEVQRRNKEAQQRFRDRQKAKLKEAEDEVAALKLKLEEAALEKRALEEQLAEFTRTLSQRDELIAQLRAGQEVAGAGEQQVARFPSNLRLTVYPDQEILVTQPDIAKLRREEMVVIWKDYVNALANLLPSKQLQLSEAAAQRITQLTQEATRLLLCVADSSPAMFKSFAACKLEPAASSDFGDDGLQLWRAVTGLLQLTAEQRANMVELRRACLASLSDIINERNRIHMFLTAAMPAAVGARHTASQYLKAHEGIEQLKVNLKKEHDLKVDWMTAVYCNVLRPVQVARAIVHAMPWAPDTMAVAAVVAAEGGDATALTHLRADISGGPAAFVRPDQHCSHGPGVDGLSLARGAPEMQRQGSDKNKRPPVATPFAQEEPVLTK